MERLNVLYAIKVAVRDERILKGLKDKLIAGMESSGEIKVNKLDFVFSKQEIEEKVALKEYHLLISADTFGKDNNKDNISCGSIKIWRNADPDIKIILTPPVSKKGSVKMIKLFMDVAYFDALYEEDVTGDAIARLFLNSRTMDDAIDYYGIAESNEVVQLRKARDKKSGDGVDVEAGEKTKDSVTVEIAEEKEPVSEEDVAYYAEQFAKMEEEEIEKEEDATSDMDIKEEEEAKVFGFFNKGPGKEPVVSVAPREIPSYEKDETVGTTFENPELVAATLVNTMNSYKPMDKETLEHVNHMADVFDEETKEIIAGVPAVIVGRVGRENVLPTSGKILRVIERHTFIFEFKEQPVLEEGESLEDYKFVLRVQGKEKGRIEKGRYRSGNIMFEAYVGFMVGKLTAMMDTIDFDCVENKEALDSKVCDIVMVKL